MHIIRTALAGAVLLAPPVAAQIDYRNLDEDRPARIEDAYPIERFAFELLAPYRVERHERVWTHSVVPELSYGLAPGAHAGIKAALAVRDAPGESKFALAGLRVFALVNLHNESPALPALSLRVDATAPVGGLAGEGGGLAVKALATRSFGLLRLHANASVALASPGQPAAAEPMPDWSLGLAVDRSLLRSSTVLIAELVLLREEAGAPLSLNALVGARRQLTPTLVLDAGIGRGLKDDAGPSFAFTLGLSHAFALKALMPRGAP